MKRTITRWAVFYGRNRIAWATQSLDENSAIDDIEQINGRKWSELKEKGYRCRKVTISWEE